MKKEKRKTKKRAGKIALGIIGRILGIVLVFAAVAAVMTHFGNKANSELIKTFQRVENPDAIMPQKDADGCWSFTTDRELKIMQLTDIHIGGGFMSKKKDAMAINAVASMVTAEKPDLIVVTGDISFPVPFISGTLNNLNSAKLFAQLMETLGVYWIPMFGNHDTEAYSYYSREDVSEFYSSEEFKYCLFQSGSDDVDGYGNSIIKVKNSDGIVTKPLVIMDSHSYIDSDFLGIFWKYDNIHQNQIDWYKSNIESIRAYNTDLANKLYGDDTEKLQNTIDNYSNTNALLFFHIPLREYEDAWHEYAANGYSDTENVKRLYGHAGEKDEIVCCSTHDDELFETIQQLGGNAGIFCGHDHLNGYSLDYKGVTLTYGMSIDYLAYSGISKIGSQRGCTIITVKPDGTFESKPESYYQDKYAVLSDAEKESVTMQEFAH